MLKQTILPYDWPCKGIIPAEKQMLTSAFMVYNPHSFVLNDPGTGKTLAALWAADFLMSRYERYKVRALIIAPLSTLTQVWKKEIFTHFTGRRNCVVVHGSKGQRMKALNTRADFYIMNIDGIKVPDVYNRLLVMHEKIKIAIVDESTGFKNWSSKRNKRAKDILHYKPYCWLMTGTPTPQGPEDAHGQARLCHPKYEETKTAFRNRVKTQVGTHRWINTHDSYNQAKAILQPAIRIPRHAMHDLPPSIPVPYKVPFSDQQKKLYEQLKKEYKTILGTNKAITAVHEGALRIKLLQIAAGAVYDGERFAHLIDCEPRLRQLREVIHDCPNKLLVFANFTSVLTLLYDTFKKEVSSAMVHGGTPRKHRDKIFADFQEKDEPKVIFADPRTMSHGLTLTRATVTAWWGPTDSVETYIQANYRIDRPGKTQDTYIVQIGSSPVEWEIYERLAARQNMQGVMLKMMEDME